MINNLQFITFFKIFSFVQFYCNTTIYQSVSTEPNSRTTVCFMYVLGFCCLKWFYVKCLLLTDEKLKNMFMSVFPSPWPAELESRLHSQPFPDSTWWKKQNFLTTSNESFHKDRQHKKFHSCPEVIRCE